ncbi:MAG: UbiD family decarboxylase [Planctomycetota bacterium]|jgi:4-hydroxy-3-polyprenylbenzoate decarboxylase
MALSSLREFISALEVNGELHRVEACVSPLLEIAEIADRQSKAPCPAPSRHANLFDPDHGDRGGKALLFTDVDGCDFPLLINAYGSYRRMEIALGTSFDKIAARLASLTKPEPPGSLMGLLSRAKEFAPLLRVPPRRVRHGACQQVVKLARLGEVKLSRLPLIKCWPLDGDPVSVGADVSPEAAGTAFGAGRYITFAGIHTIHADDEGKAKPPSHNIGMYRLQLVDETRLVMHWHMHHDGAAHWRSWKRKGRPMPVAICLGGESVLPYAATAPMPPGMSELLMAGFLNGKGIAMVDAKTVPLRVPANSEIVIEGYVSTDCGTIGWDPSDPNGLGPGAAFEGPFGDHTGYYSLPDRYPVVSVTALTHRRDAVYPTTIVGLPPQEDYYLGKATERIFLPLLKTIVHDIADYHLPMFGCFHNCAFVKIRKEYPLQGRRVMHAIWGAGQMAWTKVLIVVDDDVDVHDEQAVWRAVFSNTNFARDVELVNGPLDILDHAAPRLGAGTKLGIDATRKVTGEEVGGIPVNGPADRRKPGELEGIHFPAFGRGRCAFVSVDKTEAGQGASAVEAVLGAGVADFVIAVDASVDLRDSDAVLFQWTANCDPGRDRFVFGSAIGFDATPKLPGDARNGEPVRDWPPPIEMNEATRSKVSGRWSEYGF